MKIFDDKLTKDEALKVLEKLQNILNAEDTNDDLINELKIFVIGIVGNLKQQLFDGMLESIYRMMNKRKQ